MPRQCALEIKCASLRARKHVLDPAFAPVVPLFGVALRRQDVVCRRRCRSGVERQHGRARFHASMDAGAPEVDKDGSAGVNVTKYASQRSIMSTDKDVTPEEINKLFVKCGKTPRDVKKWSRAIEHSYVLVTAKLLKSGTLVGFARATSDRALNGTIWDLVTDPALPDQRTMSRNLIQYLLTEIRRTVPTCSIALIADPDQVHFFEDLDFVTEPDGIVQMQLLLTDEN